MSEFEFKDVLFIGPADDSEDSWASKCFVNHLLNNKIKVSWKPYGALDFNTNLDKKLKKVKNTLLNYKQVVIDDSIQNWEAHSNSLISSNKIILAVLREKKLNAEDVKKINSLNLDYICVFDLDLKNTLIENKILNVLLLSDIKILQEEDELDDGLNNKILLGSGWHDLEIEKSKYFRWASEEVIIEINSTEFKFIEISSINEIENKRIDLYVKKEKDDYVLLEQDKYKIGDFINFKIDLKNLKKIKIVSDCKSGLDLGNSEDNRKLAFKLKSIKLATTVDDKELSVEKISLKEEASLEAWTFKDNLIINSSEFFSRKFVDVPISFNNKKLSHGIILHLHTINPAIKKSLSNLSEYKKSKKDFQIIVFSCYDLEIPDHYNIRFVQIDDDFNNTKVSRYSKSDAIGFWAFIKAIEIAKELEFDYFFYYEWDCMVGADYWYDILWDECLSWQEEPIMMGTPVLKYPITQNSNLLTGSSDYRYHYSKECKLDMLVERCSPAALYTNGALSFYNTRIVESLYKKELSIDSFKRSLRASAPAPWDLDIGTRVLEVYKDESFNKVGWLPSVYSGCGDVYYNKKQRKQMIESKLKVAIHQYKYKI